MDFDTLNDERKKLARARKVTIYIDEEIFLKLKWTGKLLSYDPIKLKRIESCELDHLFEWT